MLHPETGLELFNIFRRDQAIFYFECSSSDAYMRILLSNYCSFIVRSDNERLQSLTTKQAQEITENALYIKELEERERLLAQNVMIWSINEQDDFFFSLSKYLKSRETAILCANFVICCFQWKIEDLLIDIRETETEVARWREACELEVEAGKNEVEERDKVVRTSLLSNTIL